MVTVRVGALGDCGCIVEVCIPLISDLGRLASGSEPELLQGAPSLPTDLSPLNRRTCWYNSEGRSRRPVLQDTANKADCLEFLVILTSPNCCVSILRRGRFTLTRFATNMAWRSMTVCLAVGRGWSCCLLRCSINLPLRMVRIPLHV